MSVSYGTPILTSDILQRAHNQVLNNIPQMQRQAFEQDWRNRATRLIAIAPGIRRVMSVAYRVTVLVNDQIVPNNQFNPPALGPDIYLGMDDEKLRPIMRGGS